VLICDADSRIVAVNPAFCEITGYQPPEVLGENPRLLASGRQDAELYRAMWREIGRRGRWHGEIWNCRKDGSIYPEWLSITALRDPQERITHYIGIFSDISRHKADQARIHFLAYYDPLTHLPNRSLLAERFDLAAALARRHGRQLALMFIDLDRFKQVNDTLGHVLGDNLLRAVARRFGACIRSSDTLARLGGDEFIVLLADLHQADEAALVARKCVDALTAPIELSSHELRITPSIGIAVYPQDGETLDDLIKSADTAMYEAKDGGRNTYRYYTGDMNARLCERAQLEKDLRVGIDRGEFVLHFQPQIEIASGRILALEALVRWQHPQRGLIAPDRFIPVAEETGLIVALGEWILGAACRQNALWQKAGLPAVRVAVNLSGEQLRRDGLYSAVTAALSAGEMAPQQLELELTESLLIHDIERNLRLLADLKALGVHLAVDDFGTGYSSLSYLKRFPVDRLKIDRSFVRDLVADAEDRAIAATVIAMGHRLGLRVVAEGVETHQQLEFLRREGCDEGQGFLFSRPVPAEAVPELLRAGALPLQPVARLARVAGGA
jgi:diguanylate cyclase (GGDEF)-like protein/PAS domain S-box-containing protein